MFCEELACVLLQFIVLAQFKIEHNSKLNSSIYNAIVVSAICYSFLPAIRYIHDVLTFSISSTHNTLTITVSY